MSNDVVIRALTPDDEDGVASVWEACFPDQPRRNDPRTIIARKREVMPELLRVALLDGEVVGAVVGGWDGYRSWIYHVATAPEHQRKGIATALVRDLEERLRALGSPKVNLQVLPENAAVQAFYKSLGFGIEDRLCFGKLLEDE